MYLITWKETNTIADYTGNIKYLCNGDPFIPGTNVSYPVSCTNVFCVEGIPDSVFPGGFCYTETEGFYENTNWGKPFTYSIDPEVMKQIKDTVIIEIQQEVNKNEFNTETTGTGGPA